MSVKRISDAIRKHKSFLITTHVSPEGDALGSALALAGLLRRLGKRAVILNDDNIPMELLFLPGAKSIGKLKANLKVRDFDCFIIIDCSDMSRAGKVHRLNRPARTVLNIDHHISNSNFADINWVESKASSASEMVYQLYKYMKVPFTRESAIQIFSGIMTDTGSFRYTNTSAYTFAAAADLMKFKLDVRTIYRNIYENIPYSVVKTLARIFSGIKVAYSGQVAWAKMPRGVPGKKKTDFDFSDNVLSFIRKIKDVQVAVLFRETAAGKNEIRFNLRSNGKVDVNKIAKVFGGGGHKAAAGCTMRGRISEVRKKVIAEIRLHLK